MNAPSHPNSVECDAAYHRVVRRQLDPGLGIAAAVAVGVFTLAGLLPLMGGGVDSAIVAGTASAWLWAGIAITSRARRKERMQDLDLLVAAGDPRAAAPLLEELRFHCSRYEGPVRDTLIRVLPRVSKDDALFHYGWYQEALHHALLHTADPNTLVALLGAMAQVGDGRGIGYVRMLAENEAHFVRDARVTEAAQAALPFLRRRLSGGAPAPDLLRAAMSPSDDADALLRTAARSYGEDMLLRPPSAAVHLLPPA